MEPSDRLFAIILLADETALHRTSILITGRSDRSNLFARPLSNRLIASIAVAKTRTSKKERPSLRRQNTLPGPLIIHLGCDDRQNYLPRARTDPGVFAAG